MVTALMQRFQEIENDFWAFLNAIILANHPMAGGPWSILDQIGAIVGAPRNGRSDADYLPGIKIQIAINRSNGHPEDIIKIVALITNGAIYREWPPADIEIAVPNTTEAIAKALAAYVPKGTPGGVSVDLRYSVSTGNVIRWGSTTSPGTYGIGYGDSTGSITNVMASAQKIG